MPKLAGRAGQSSSRRPTARTHDSITGQGESAANDTRWSACSRIPLFNLLGNECLDRIGIRIHDDIPLWQVFDILIHGWTRGLMPNGFDNAIGKFNRERGFQAD